MNDPATMQSTGLLKNMYSKEVDTMNNTTPLQEALKRRREKMKEKINMELEEKSNAIV